MLGQMIRLAGALLTSATVATLFGAVIMLSLLQSGANPRLLMLALITLPGAMGIILLVGVALRRVTPEKKPMTPVALFDVVALVLMGGLNLLRLPGGAVEQYASVVTSSALAGLGAGLLAAVWLLRQRSGNTP